jgi:acetyltransferase
VPLLRAENELNGYPKVPGIIQESELATVEMLGDGTEIRLRPVHPEDEFLLQDLLVHMTPEDRRFRFFMTMTELSREFAARLSHADGVREIAFLAQPADATTALGVARYAAELDNRHAEFAIAVLVIGRQEDLVTS